MRDRFLSDVSEDWALNRGRAYVSTADPASELYWFSEESSD